MNGIPNWPLGSTLLISNQLYNMVSQSTGLQNHLHSSVVSWSETDIYLDPAWPLLQLCLASQQCRFVLGLVTSILTTMS